MRSEMPGEGGVGGSEEGGELSLSSERVAFLAGGRLGGLAGILRICLDWRGASVDVETLTSGGEQVTHC
jgi:hypothetical protein